MKSLRGVWCAACLKMGHKCQAQMWDGDEAVCLPCGNREACSFAVIAAQRLERAVLGECDVFDFVPSQLIRVPRPVEHVLPVIGTQELCELREALEEKPFERVAADAHLTVDALRASIAAHNARRESRVKISRAEVRFEVYKAQPFVLPDAVPVEDIRIVPAAKPCAELTMRTILKVVAHHFGINASDITGRSRVVEVVRPRQIALYLGEQLLHFGASDLGRVLHLHHTTVIYSVRKIRNGIKVDNGLDTTVQTLKMKVIEACDIDEESFPQEVGVVESAHVA